MIVPIMGMESRLQTAQKLLGKTRVGVLRLLLSQPDHFFGTTHIIKTVRAGRGSVQRELRLLASEGIIKRRVEGRAVLYHADVHSPAFGALSALVLQRSPDIEMQAGIRLALPSTRLARFCRQHHIRKLAFFGSVLRPDFSPDSDIDVLVEFESGQVPGFEIVGMEQELSSILGRKVDLRTAGDLNRRFRDQVVREARVAYDAKA